MNRPALSALSALLLWAGAASASLPQRDLLAYEGQQSVVTMRNQPRMPVPPSDRLTTLRSSNYCSAPGGPVTRWAIIDSTLYLTHFSDCGTNMPLGEIYEGVRSPLVATWLSGELHAGRGRIICFTMEKGAVAETALTFTVDQGIVTDVEERDNSAGCPD
jgi:hypothetical protein